MIINKNKASSIFKGALNVIVLSMLLTSSVQALNLSYYPKLQTAIEPLVQQGVYSQAELDLIFSRIELKEEVIKKKSNSAESKLTWGGGRREGGYKGIFIQKERIQLGVQFWNDNKELLNRAATEIGVEPQVICAIIGVETKFGAYKGKYSVLESIATFANRGSRLQTGQLPIFLTLVKKGDLPLDVKGSYSGAMGIPQFISSSYRDFGVDFDGDGKVNLVASTADAIGSVANYFKKHRWNKNDVVMVKVQPKSRWASSQLSSMAIKSVNSRSKPSSKIANLEHLLKITPKDISKDASVGVFEFLDANDKPEYFLGFGNFYSIMKYNHSYLYARAVHELSNEIFSAYNNQ